jgi:hypothetical protein
MTEENVVALKWLIASLESRIIDLMAGKLDESLEDLAKYPIPVQYRSLCMELKCTIPNLPSLPELQSTSVIPALLKDATVNEACSESEPTELLAHNTTGNNQNLKPVGTPDNLNKATLPPISMEHIAVSKASPSIEVTVGRKSPAVEVPVGRKSPTVEVPVGRKSPTVEITVGRKRKSSIGENDDDKKQLLNAKSLEQNSLIRNSPIVSKDSNLSDLNVEAAAKVPVSSKSLTDKTISSPTSTPTTLMSPGRASTRSSRGSIVHIDEDLPSAPNSAGIETPAVISSSGGKTTTKGELHSHGVILPLKLNFSLFVPACITCTLEGTLLLRFVKITSGKKLSNMFLF